ncbi:hypothetical protein P5705_16910 [Pseudomonas entomophila]|uniref:hypothetical protein n=1 Tax=Pseudomonas entomophila TaxID=312306 RepID=UPI002406AB58|nr:hypothetical protein [Pseudomonas entomophila]MDF9619327.1 hypothetical protein [Pseudomonas entomophila]
MQDEKMVVLKARIDTFKSDSGSACFTQCCLILGDVTVGDYGQLMLAGVLDGAIKDFFERAKVCEPIQLTVSNLKVKIQEAEADIRNSYLPIGVEGFDGDFVGFVRIDDRESMVVRLWGEEALTLLDISKSNYIKFMHGLRETLAEQCKALGLNLDRDSA